LVDVDDVEPSDEFIAQLEPALAQQEVLVGSDTVQKRKAVQEITILTYRERICGSGKY
jgi:hypothetical protein